MSDLVGAILQSPYGVIEASAGTGKTHTIEELALRLLKSGVPLPRILILTYTEAATSELRQRIRARILDELRRGTPSRTGFQPVPCQDERERLRSALERFDEAAIHTIHGFCQRALNRHAFENQQPFTLEVIDDRPLYQRFLREEQRRLWPQLLGQGISQEVLADFLALSGYAGDAANSWEDAVIEVARSWRPERDMLSPAPPESIAALIAAESRKLEPVRRALLDFVQAPEDSVLTVALFERHLQQLQCLSAKLQKNLREYIVEPLVAQASSLPGHPEHRADDRERLVALVRRFEPNGRVFLDSWHKKGFACLIDDAWTKAKNRNQEGLLPAQAKRLEQLVAALCELDGLKQFFGCLGTFTASSLRRRVDAYKAAHGLLSFEDMLTRLERALNPRRNPAAPQLLEALRAQYKVALVDEFQDTDPVQWSILRRIFVGEGNEKLEQGLYVIGDPKQAIYGFRGADVTVYLEASQYLRSRQRESQDSPKLNVSYRATPELLAALNRLFQAKAEWFGHGSGIPYTQVLAPLEGRRIELQYPARERAAVNLVDLRGAEAAAPARKEMARFVAREVAWLLDWHGAPGKAGLRLVEDRNGKKEEHGLDAGDIAILVDFRRTAAIFEKALDEHRPPIPHTFYKKGGLYQSEEARHLSILLQGIAEPADHAAFRKALLTHFFRVRAEDLEAFAGLPPEHAIKQLCERWRRYAQRRNWARLFQSILEDTGVLWCYEPTPPQVPSAGALSTERPSPGTHSVPSDQHSALSTQHSVLSTQYSVLVPPDMERRGTNYQHILEELEDAARRSHLDFDGVRALLENRRQERLAESEECDLHRLETEDPKVRIMTIHASKGLEFPVVFVCAGFTAGKTKGLFTKYHALDGNGRRRTALVYNLGPDRENDQQAAEKDEEIRRVYYVALTRAQCLLYAPYLPEEKEAGSKRQRAGPACTLLKPAMDAAWPGKCDGTSVGKVAVLVQGQVAGEWPPTNQPQSTPNQEEEAAAPEGWLDPLGPDRMYITAADTLQSFSALSKSRPRPVLVLGDEKQRDWDEDAAAQLELAPVGQASSLFHEADGGPDVLPGGHHAGLALHEVLERVDFRAAKAARSWEELLHVQCTTGVPPVGLAEAPGGRSYQDLLGAAMEKHGLRAGQSSTRLADDPHAQAITRMVWSALRAELPDLPDGKLRLCDLDEADHLHELEFNLPLPSWRELPCAAPNGTWEDCRRALQATWPALKFKGPLEHTTGYLNGVIDLVFRAKQGPHCRYYVLDWKSNRLAAGYGPAGLAACMRDNHYDLQRSIYTLALLRWLAQCRSAGPFPAETGGPGEFGGVYYVFLRGVDAANPGAGFFRDLHVPRQEDLIAELFVQINSQEGGF